MFVLVDEREIVTSGYASAFEREGFATLELHAEELGDWLAVAPDSDLEAVEGFLIGAGETRATFPGLIRNRCADTPIIVLEDKPSLDTTLDFFTAGVDDVLRKPVHVKEILARVGAIRRRTLAEDEKVESGPIQVFFDGRDPIVGGEDMMLPRRERRILEYLVRNTGRRVTKSQLFNAVYGVMNEEVDECVVESHISKLRKKLRIRLGYDPVESTRYIGYMLKAGQPAQSAPKLADGKKVAPVAWAPIKEMKTSSNKKLELVNS
ncbi:DNA-binding response regulator [Roseibium polysiphoniae]|uniref:DNA-binding response regulator n=1 Tax=Roseibium polysiphoniae TaxID=2571221 RepID=A0A944CCF1_9HYPH|nr:response regulator transcription factor [Labrenzia sp. CE80]MBS8260771.1 DNA-binding response regulator [Roseibium polysiphoniae]